MQLRPYQAQAIVATLRDIRDGRYKKTVLTLPTGGGKTLVASRILNGLIQNDMSENDVIVWVAHRVELINQAAAAMRRESIGYSLWTADEKSTEGPVILTMVMSARGLKDQLERQGKRCRYMTVDEGHRSAAITYRRLEDELGPQFILNLTATPIRMDDLDLEFDKISFEKSFIELVEEGHLSKPRYISYQTGLECKLRSNDGEYSSEDLAALNNEKRNEIIIKDLINNKEEYGKTLVFCVNKDHARRLSEIMGGLLPSFRTAHIDSDTDPTQRAEILRAFSDGQIQFLFNVQVLTEGYDEPSIKTVVLARPTKSEVLWMQMVGRAARLHPTKAHFNIVDFVDSSNSYALMTEDWSVRLLGMEENPDTMKRKRDAETLEMVNQWMKDQGYSGKKLKEKREVLELDGIMTIRNKNGAKRYLVTKSNRPRLEKLIRYVANNPPDRNVDFQKHVMEYVYRQNKSLLRWPGKFSLTGISWALFFRFVLNRTTNAGLPAFEYKTLPDFSTNEQRD